MKKHNKLFLIILMLMFGAGTVSAQEVEVNPRFLFGFDYSLSYSFKNKRALEGYRFNFLHFFKEEKFYGQFSFGSVFFQQEKKSDRFVRSNPFMFNGGVRLSDFEKASFYLDGGAGVAISAEEDYTGASFQLGIRMLSANTSWGRGDISLNYIYYNFDKRAEEVLSLGFGYWLPFPKGKRKQ